MGSRTARVGRPRASYSPSCVRSFDAAKAIARQSAQKRYAALARSRACPARPHDPKQDPTSQAQRLFEGAAADDTIALAAPVCRLEVVLVSVAWCHIYSCSCLKPSNG